MLLALASCVAPPLPSPAPAPAPRPAPPPPPAPAPSSDWTDRPITPGSWTYGPEAGGSAALFGLSASQPLLVLRCDLATHRIQLARAGQRANATEPMTVRTSFGAVQWPVQDAAAPVPQIVATRAANDAALDQIAFSRGRFAVDIAGLPMVIAPAWAEVTRVIEDCRG